MIPTIRRFFASPLTLGEEVDEEVASRYRPVEVDPGNYKFDVRLLKRIWRVAKPYWVRKGSWLSIVSYGFVVLASVAMTGVWAYSTEILNDLTNAIVDKEIDLFWSLLIVWGALLLARSSILWLQSFVDTVLMLDWRRWLTRHLMGRYLKRRTYYDIALNGDIDNPDQRIQDEPRPFTKPWLICQEACSPMYWRLARVRQLSSRSPPGLFWFVSAYMIILIFVTYLLHTPTIRMNFDITVAEADLRYGILHTRDSAETVAF